MVSTGSLAKTEINDMLWKETSATGLLWHFLNLFIKHFQCRDNLLFTRYSLYVLLKSWTNET